MKYQTYPAYDLHAASKGDKIINIVRCVSLSGNKMDTGCTMCRALWFDNKIQKTYYCNATMVSAYHYTLQFHILYCKGEHATSIVISYSNYFCSGLYGPIYLYFSGVQPAFGFGILGIWLYENLVDRLCICLHQDPFCQFYSYNLVSL